MKQYNEMKAVHPDALMLFRMGDFYETFGADAVKTARILGITLTRRGNGSASETELAGFPHHALDTYLPKLVRAGERVAICEQLEDPKLTKKLVRRGIVELCTPGISFNDNVLSYKENTFLAAVCFGKKSTGVAFLDASTGEFLAAEGSNDYIAKLLSNLAPKEVIYQKGFDADFTKSFGPQYYTYRLDEWMFSPANSREKLLNQLDVKSLKGFGIDSLEHAVTAAGSTTSISPSTATRRRSPPFRASTKINTSGSTASRSATSNFFHRPRPTGARLSKRSMRRFRRWARGCCTGGSRFHSRRRMRSTAD